MDKLLKFNTYNTKNHFVICNFICDIFGPVIAKTRHLSELGSSFPTVEKICFWQYKTQSLGQQKCEAGFIS